MADCKYRCVCLDLDGTLLNSAKQISVANREAIAKLHAMGRTIIIATGRHLSETQTILEESRLIGYVDYIVYADGCYVFDCHNNNNVYSSVLTMRDVDALVRVIGSDSLVLINEQQDYEVKHYSVFRWLHCKATMEKAVVFSMTPTIRQKLEDDGFTLLEKGSAVDIIPTNKSKALKWLLEEKGATSDVLLYFGDDFNDKDCFECFDSVVMGNAPQELRRYSLVPTKTNDEEGVAMALKDLFG